MTLRAVSQGGGSSGPITGQGFTNSINTVTTNYTPTTTDYMVLGNATAGSFTITLPSATGNAGVVYEFKKVDSTANTVTINASTNGSTIDGQAAVVFNVQYQTVAVQSDGAGNWVATNQGSISPTLIRPNILGINGASNASVGSVGEYVTSNIVVGSAVALTTSITSNVTSISLTAGDWDISGCVITNPAGTTTQNNFLAGISLTSATLVAPNYVQLPFTANTGGASATAVPTVRVNVNATTTVFLVAQVSFAISTCGAYGFIGARRSR